MGARGRPRHPDILTPREWEVLEFLRQRLTNEQIAERLGITLDGAKYHVSEILSKLGVSSREEAAVWRPEERRAGWLRWPLWARIAGAATVAAAVAGVLMLAWGVAETGGPAERARNELESSPVDGVASVLSRDDALVIAAGVAGGPPRGVRSASVELTTYQRARGTLGGRGVAEPLLASREPAADASVWLVFLLAVAGESPEQFGIPPPSVPVCVESYALIDDASSEVIAAGGVSVGDPDECPTAPAASDALTRDQALVAVGNSGVVGARDVSIERVAYGSAVQTIDERRLAFAQPLDAPVDSPVWLVLLKGTSYLTSTQRICSEFALIFDDSLNYAIAQSRDPLDSCP